MSNQRKAALTATSSGRVSGVSTEQTVKATAGTLWGIVISNANAAVKTLTIKDNTSTLIVIQCPATSSFSLAFGCKFATSLKVTPNHADLDCLFVYD